MPNDLNEVPRVFFAYPSVPTSCGDAMRLAAGKLIASKAVHAQTWEDLKVGGRVLVETICQEIDLADVVVADITNLNPNVLFELGYAIARQKRVWLANDTTIADSERKQSAFRILTTIGYAKYTNSEDIKKAFFKDSPHLSLEDTLFRDFIKERLTAAHAHSALYLRSRTRNEASLRLDALLQGRDGILIDDPDEGTQRSLSEYANLVWICSAALCHLANPSRIGSDIDNARQSLVAGLAHGFDRPLLIVAEGEFASPADYRDICKHYTNSAQACGFAERWLNDIAPSVAKNREISKQNQALQLHTDLRSLDLGGYVAEDEEAELVDKYFIETAAYLDAIGGKSTIFVGRKGCGKTANLLKLRSTLEADRRNVVTTIKPVSYEIASFLGLMHQLQQRGERGHVLENLWMFMLYTEIAKDLMAKLGTKSQFALTDEEQALVAFGSSRSTLFQDGFSLRLERCVAQLASEAAQLTSKGTAGRDGAISQALHLGMLGELKRLLFGALRRDARVFVLIDNLDKAWDKSSEIDVMAPALLSLFAVVNNLRRDFTGGPMGSRVERFGMSVFVRSDIFAKVIEHAREPDKIPASFLRWDDGEMLLRVLEERFLRRRPTGSPSEIWSKYFVKEVDGVATQQYLLSAIQPRPRDLLFLIHKAVDYAVNRRHSIIEAEDIVSARREYSQFAVRSVLVENGVSLQKLEDLLFEFAGGSATIDDNVIKGSVVRVGLSTDKIPSVTDHLVRLGILGLEVRPGVFWWANDDGTDLKKHWRMAERLAEGATRRFRVAAAFQPFLEVDGQ